jgi:hypothetical protein
VTAWWRTQSHTNRSPHPNSLLTGKRTGNFVNSALSGRFLKADTQANSKASSEIPYATEQGIISAEQGILAQEQGISPAQTEIIAE